MLFRHALPLIVPILLLVAAARPTAAQTVVLYNVDASAFPTIRANVVVLDGTGRRVPDLTAADFNVIEDGFPVTDLVVTCPPPAPEQPFNAVLVNDHSGSMSLPISATQSRMDLVRAGSSEFVNLADFSGQTAIAITRFNEQAEIVSDFRQARAPLLAAIATLAADGGTLYDPPFLDPLAGAIGMLASRPANIRRIIVFLTDGQPNARPSTNAIGSAAMNAGVEVYSITVGMPMNPDLWTISMRTGGSTFGNVRTVEQIRAIYQEIALNARGVEPCTISWRSRARCGVNDRTRNVGITHIPTGATTRLSYEAPMSSVIGFEADPEFLYFGTTAPPDSLDRQVVVTARNDTMTVDRGDITPTGAFRVIDWGGTPPPFDLAPDQSRTITVRFRPSDSSKHVASLLLIGSPCPPFPITLTGGAGSDDGPALELLAPLGGEAFSGCDSVTIRWGGVAPDQPIDIDYSIDDGATWRRLVGGVSGLSYRWMPPDTGSRYRVRVTALSSEKHIIASLAGGGLINADSIPSLQAVLYSPSGVAYRDDTLYIAEAGGHRVRRVDMTNGIISTLAGTGNPGYNGELYAINAHLNAPSHIELYGNYLFIADQSNHRVRAVNVFDGRIIPVAGTGKSGFSGDGGPALNAELQYPSWLAANGTRIYVSDVGNSRVRSVDVSTGIIQTVAGGGSNPAQNIPATSAVLAPAGIAFADGFLYIAEPTRSWVRRVDMATGLISIVAGTGYPGISGDGGQATAAMLQAPYGVHVHRSVLYIADSGGHQIRAVDLATGIITTLAGTSAPGFSGDGGEAVLARLKVPAQPTYGDGLLFFPDLGNNRVRAVTIGRGPASDSSRGPFTVSVARLSIERIAGRRITLAPAAVGVVRDSAIAGVICSRGSLPLVVDSARITGNNPGDFAIVSGIPTADIEPGTCEPLEIRFQPSSVGPRSATLILYGRCANSDTLQLEATAIAPCDIASTDLVRFDTTIVGGDPRDTVIIQSICNTGATPISGNVRLASGAPSYTITSGGGPFTLARGECRQIQIRFAPIVSGRVSGRIEYGTPPACGPTGTLLFGVGVGGPELAVLDAVAWPAELCPGVARDTVVTLRNTGGAPLAVTSATFSSNDGAFALLDPPPTPAAPLMIAPGASADLRIRFAPSAPGQHSATLEIESNAPPSPRSLALSGRLELVALAGDGTVATFGPDAGATYPRDTLLPLYNRGTVAVTVIDAQIAGPDAALFEVAPGQLPSPVASGSSTTLRVRLLSPPVDRALHARVVLTFEPSCDSGLVHIELLAGGNAPALAAVPPVFRDLVCESGSDTLLVLRNAGGSDLSITGATVTNDPEGSFIVTPSLPILIPPGEERQLSISFSPSTAGVKTAELVLTSNDPESPHLISLRGVRHLVAIAAEPTPMVIGPIVPGTSIDEHATLTNTGTAALHIELSLVTGAFSIVGAASRPLPAGGLEEVVLRFSPAVAGVVHDTLVAVDEGCGELARIPIEGFSSAPALTRAKLPVLAARPGEHVSIPITVTVLDRAAFIESGARGCTLTVRFLGTVLVPERVTGATLLENRYDMASRLQTMRLVFDYNEGAPAPTIEAKAIQGDTLGTPLRWVEVLWDNPAVGTDLVDGFFTTIGSCYNNGLTLIASPVVLKVRPTPARDVAEIDIALEEWGTLDITVVDALGAAVLRKEGILLGAGRHSVPITVSSLPAGIYTTIVSSPYGSDVAKIVVTR